MGRDDRGRIEGYRGGRGRVCRTIRGGGSNANRLSRLSCHSCGIQGHISRNFWAPGGSSEVQGPGTDHESDINTNNNFPGVDDV